MLESSTALSSGNVHYLDSKGKGLPVLLVHGNSMSAPVFQYQLVSEELKDFRMIAMDLPGHGASPPALNPKATYCLAGYAQALLEFTRALKLDEYALVGHSLGSHVLMEGLGDFSGALGLAVFGAVPLGIPPAMDRAFFPHPITTLAFQDELTPEQVECFLDVLAGDEPILRNLAKNWLLHTDPRARLLLGRSIMEGRFKDELIALEEFGGKVALLHGKNEPVVNSNYYRELDLSRTWGGKVHVIEKAAHTPQWQNPTGFNRLLKGFLNDLG